MTSATATAAPTRLAPNDEVTINDYRYAGQVWVVERVKQVKAIIKPKGQPGHRGLDAPLSMLTKIEPGTTPVQPTMPTLTIQSLHSLFGVGNIVTLNSTFRTYEAGSIMIVTGINRSTINLDRLGGNRPGESGMRGGRDSVTKVDLADLPALLLAQQA